MEHEAAAGGFVAVEDVAEDGAAEAAALVSWGVGEGVAWRGGVDADLMGAAGDGLELDFAASNGAAGADVGGGCGEEAEVGACVAAVDEVDDLVWAAIDVEAHGEVDCAAGLGGGSFEEGGVALGDGAAFELVADCGLRLGREADDEEAGGIHVEAVDDEGAAGARDHLADAADDALGLVGPFARDGEEARGLVNDDVAAGLVDDAEGGHGWRLGDVWWCGMEGAGCVAGSWCQQ